MGVFYGLQGAINGLIGISRRVGLMANVAKSNDTTCQAGAMYTGM